MADITVGIGEARLSSCTGDKITTFSLGSCLGLTVYDPVTKVGGMIHCQLPNAKLNPQKASETPAAFVDTGIPYLFRKAYAMGAEKSRLIVKIAGCANQSANGKEEEIFKIGERNYITARKMLWQNGILISAEEIGGGASRTLSLDIDTGIVTIKSAGKVITL